VGQAAIEKDIYTLHSGDPMTLEDLWTSYERELSVAIDELLGAKITATRWLGVLVPFVASLLVRAPEFNERFDERIKQMVPSDIELSADNTNFARMLEIQRLLAPVLTARWVVGEAQGAGSLITSDVGWVGFRAPQTDDIGLAIPLTKRAVLQLIPARRRVVAHLERDAWVPTVEYRRLSSGSHLALNEVLAETSKRYVFGPDESTIKNHVRIRSAVVPQLEPHALGFASGPLARVHEFTWHYLVTMLARGPQDNVSVAQEIDWQAVASRWKFVVLPANPGQIMYPPGIRRQDMTIEVDLYDVAGLTDRDDPILREIAERVRRGN
jgi:hypothetical protein